MREDEELMVVFENLWKNHPKYAKTNREIGRTGGKTMSQKDNDGFFPIETAPYNTEVEIRCRGDIVKAVRERGFGLWSCVREEGGQFIRYPDPDAWRPIQASVE